MKRNSLTVSLVGGGIALLCCLLPWIKVELEQLVSLQFGGFGAAIGFIVTLIGAWSLPKSDPSMENSE